MKLQFTNLHELKGYGEVAPILPQLPDLSRPLRIMDLCFKIEQKMVYSDNLIADSVRLAMHNGTPYVLILDMLRSMAVDNRRSIEDMLGVQLTSKLFSV